MDSSSVLVGLIVFAMWLGWQSGKNPKQDNTDVAFKRRVRDRKNGRGGNPMIINQLKEELMSRGVVPMKSDDPATQHALLDYQMSLTDSDKIRKLTQNAFVPKEGGLARTAGQKILVREQFAHLRGSMWPAQANNQYD